MHLGLEAEVLVEEALEVVLAASVVGVLEAEVLVVVGK